MRIGIIGILLVAFSAKKSKICLEKERDFAVSILRAPFIFIKPPYSIQFKALHGKKNTNNGYGRVVRKSLLL